MPRIGAPVRNTIEVFWSKVSPSGSCWFWEGKVTHEGYGYMWLKGSTKPAHRIAYLDLVGSIPEGMHLDHLCRTRSCVNPDHLEIVTPRINSERANAPRVNAETCTNGHRWNATNTLQTGESKRCRQCLLVRSHISRGRDCSYEKFCSDESHKITKTQPRSKCGRGHSLADAYIRPDTGHRQCKECRRMRNEPKEMDQ